MSGMFTQTTMSNNALADFATVLIGATNMTQKNLYNTNSYSPFYQSSTYINNATIGSSLVSQLRSTGWSVPE